MLTSADQFWGGIHMLSFFIKHRHFESSEIRYYLHFCRIVLTGQFLDYKINDKDFPLEDLILPNSKNNSRKYIDDYMYENNIKFNPKYELDNYILVYDFVKNGLGIAFVNLDYYEDKIDKKEVYPLCPNTTINLRNFSVYCNSNAFNPAKTKFCDILK